MATDELFHTVATYKLSTLHRSLDRDEESSRVLEEFLCHVRRLDWRVGRIRSDLGSKYVTKLQPPDAMTLRYSRWWSLNLKNLNSRWMARKSMASSSVSTIRWMKWRTRSITAWWPQIFFGNTCTVIWTGYIKLVHSGLISFPICFCQTTPFLTSFTLCFVTWVAGFNKTMDVTKGEHDLPRRIFKLWYWVHRVWPRIIDNVVLMKVPSLDVIKFAHFWYSLEEENIDNIWWL